MTRLHPAALAAICLLTGCCALRSTSEPRKHTAATCTSHFTGDGECVVIIDPIKTFPSLIVSYGSEEDGTSAFNVGVESSVLGSDKKLAVVDTNGNPLQITGKKLLVVYDLDGTGANAGVLMDGHDLMVNYITASDAPDFLAVKGTLVESGNMIDHILLHLQIGTESAIIQFQRY